MENKIVKRITTLMGITILTGLTACSSGSVVRDQFIDVYGEGITSVQGDSDLEYTDIYGDQITDDHLNFKTGKTPVLYEARTGLLSTEPVFLEDFTSVPKCELSDLPADWQVDDRWTDGYTAEAVPAEACLMHHAKNRFGEDGRDVLEAMPALNEGWYDIQCPTQEQVEELERTKKKIEESEEPHPLPPWTVWPWCEYDE